MKVTSKLFSIVLVFLLTFSMIFVYSCKDTPSDDYTDDDSPQLESPNDDSSSGGSNGGNTGTGDNSGSSGNNNGDNSGNNSGSEGGNQGGSTGDDTTKPDYEVSAKSGVMLQGFNWGSAPRTASTHWGKWYKIMINNADAIGDKFSYVWLKKSILVQSQKTLNF